MAAKKIYKVVFSNEDQVWEVYAREVLQSDMFGFIEVAGLLFGEKSSIVVDPSEDKLMQEFSGVDRTYIPLHSIVRIDSVERKGHARILPAGEGSKKVTPLKTVPYTPPTDKKR